MFDVVWWCQLKNIYNKTCKKTHFSVESDFVFPSWTWMAADAALRAPRRELGCYLGSAWTQIHLSFYFIISQIKPQNNSSPKISWPRGQIIRLVRVHPEFSCCTLLTRSLGWRRRRQRLAAAMMTVRMLVVVMMMLRWRRGLQIPPPATLTPRWTLDVSVWRAFSTPPNCHMLFDWASAPPRANCPLIGLPWLHLGTGAAIPALFIPPPCLHFPQGRGQEFKQHEYIFMSCSRQNDSWSDNNLAVILIFWHNVPMQTEESTVFVRPADPAWTCLCLLGFILLCESCYTNNQ